jgi:hypothetical protein
MSRANSIAAGRVKIGPEQVIEDQVVKNLAWFGYARAQWIRRAKLGRGGFGSVDPLILPRSGPHRVVLIEVKHEGSKDTPGRLVGQLLAYYLAALRLGSEGLRCLGKFAQTPRAHDTGGKSLQMLSGLGRGCKPRDLERLRAGRKLTSGEVALVVVIGRDDGAHERRESFRDLREWLKKNGAIDIRVVIARTDGSFEPI